MRQKAIIVDLDGTLVKSQNPDLFRKPTGGHDWVRWMESNRFAPVHDWCKTLVIAMAHKGFKIIFMTARSTEFSGKEITTEWLNAQLNPEGIYDFELIMRPIGDCRPDTEVKLMLYTAQVAPHYDVLFALDDTQRVIDLWRNLNITALHCADY